ncbi:MAG TPA: molybdopterin molybdotransferase MoeA [Bacteroidia bacterium]|nr:molybdopterin molybdotransferase MoeA [Bacteroidia bacterium]
MVSLSEACDIIFNQLLPVNIEEVKVSDSLKRILAEDIFSPTDVPSFNQSAVDGYAIRKENFIKDKKWIIKGEIKAGDNLNIDEQVFAEGTYKIFTGAMVPSSVNCIIMKEYADVDISKNTVRFNLENVKDFQNIRKAGEELSRGEKLFSRGTIIDAEHIAVLASLGIRTIKTYKLFSIKIVVTGNELKSIDDKDIQAGEKFESNGIMLANLLKKYFNANVQYEIVPDDEKKIFSAIKNATDTCDIVITTGGVSVGDYDFTKPIIQKLGFQIKFDKVAQKPGKPFVFAVHNDTSKIIFALPGNPRATLTCFYWYILRYLLKCYQTNKEWILPVLQLPLNNDYLINDNRSRILFANIENNGITIPEKQDSHMLITSAKANGLIVLENSKRKNELVNVYLLR